MHARHLGSEISDCGVVVGPGSRETIPNQGVALVHGQGSLAHEGTLRARVTFPHGSGSGAAVSYVSGPSEASLTCHCLCLS